ncbi:MAG: hypothetical protein ACI4A8_10055 [Muribaculaceae bacterium]
MDSSPVIADGVSFRILQMPSLRPLARLSGGRIHGFTSAIYINRWLMFRIFQMPLLPPFGGARLLGWRRSTLMALQMLMLLLLVEIGEWSVS